MTKITLLATTLLLTLNVFTQTQPEINVVYGDKHIFTIETPTNWYNDKAAAQTIDLVCFFYPLSEKGETHTNYMYAHGIDKVPNDNILTEFIKNDIEVYKKKYPDFKYETVPVGVTGGLRNGVLYSFSNLSDRYKEEVLYSESDNSFIIFSYSALTEADYKKYQPVFDQFIGSFNYRGNNPQPFLDYMNSQNKQ